ncbi:MAG: hypothetical protein ACYCX4_02200 [Bacillota bacterium]
MSKNNHFNEDERELMAILEQAVLPDDLSANVLQKGVHPSAEAIARIKQRALSNAIPGSANAASEQLVTQTSHGKFTRKRWLWTVAAVLVLAFSITALTGPQKVLAELKGFIRFVPGFGLMASDQVTLSIDAPIKVKKGQFSLEVAGLVADSQHTILHLLISGIVFDPRNVEDAPYLLDPTGHRYLQVSSNASIAGNKDMEAWLAYDPLPAITREVKLVVPSLSGLTEQWEVAIPLVPSESLRSAEQLGPTVTRQKIAVTGMASFNPEESNITLLVTTNEPGALIHEIGRYTSTAANREVTLKDNNGTSYIQDRHGIIPANPWELVFSPVKADIDTATLNIPLIIVQERGEAKVTIPIANEEVELNKEVRLGRFILILRRAKLIDGQLQVWVDAGPEGEETLQSFSFELPRGTSSWMSKQKEYNAQMEYFAVPVSPGQRSLTLTIKDPVVAIKGPWELTFPVKH